MRPLPEGDEAEEILRLLAFPDIRVGVALGPAVGILGHEGHEDQEGLGCRRLRAET